MTETQAEEKRREKENGGNREKQRKLLEKRERERVGDKETYPLTAFPKVLHKLHQVSRVGDDPEVKLLLSKHCHIHMKQMDSHISQHLNLAFMYHTVLLGFSGPFPRALIRLFPV